MQNNSQVQTGTNKTKSLSLKNTLLELKALAKREPITIGTLIHKLDSKGFGVFLAILALPSALPIPAPGYSTPFGIAIGLLALQMLIGKAFVWLPSRLTKVTLGPKLLTQMLNVGTNILSKLETIIQPRLTYTNKRWFIQLIAVQVLVLACLMILPIPMTNTFPAMIIFLIAIGISENDGLICIVGAFLSILAILFYMSLLSLVAKFGIQVMDHLF